MTTAEQDVRIPDSTLERWQSVVNILADVLEVPSALITRADPPLIEVVRTAQREGNPYARGMKAEMTGHYCEAVITRNQAVRVRHAPGDPHWWNAPEIDYQMVAYLGLPLNWPDRSVFGTICILDDRENPFGPRYEALLTEFKELVEAHLELVETSRLLKDRNESLQTALSEIKTLQGLIPICAHCKSIRDDQGYWQQVEAYLDIHTDATFSHGFCPDCLAELYPDL